MVCVPSRMLASSCVFFFQAEDGIRDLVRSRGLGDVYKRQRQRSVVAGAEVPRDAEAAPGEHCQPVVGREPEALSLIHI